jgi:hypothetical protein
MTSLIARPIALCFGTDVSADESIGEVPLYRLRFSPDPETVDAAARTPGPSPQANAEACVSALLKEAGCGNVLVCIEDPSAPGSWTAIVARKPDKTLAVEWVEPVVTDVPSAYTLARSPSLDSRLLSDEARAVALALLKDTDPDRLEGMAACFAPDLPVVGALLHTRARLERARRNLRPKEVSAQAHHEASVSERLQHAPSYARRGLGTRSGVPFAPTDEAGTAVDMLRQATLGLGAAAASTWDRYGGAVRVLLPEDGPVTAQLPGTSAAVRSTVSGAPASSVDVASAFDGVCRCTDLASAPPGDLAAELGVDLQVATAVLDCVKRPGGGVVLVDPAKANVISGLGPVPSASAIQLAAGQVRPLDVGLSDPQSAGRTLVAMRRAGPYDEAAAQVERAKRAVARRVWVEWWQRAEKAGMLGDVR